MTMESKSRSEWEYIINQHVFDEQARYILTRHLLDGITYERIAEELDVSRTTVFVKYKKWEPQLFKNC